MPRGIRTHDGRDAKTVGNVVDGRKPQGSGWFVGTLHNAEMMEDAVKWQNMSRAALYMIITSHKLRETTVGDVDEECVCIAANATNVEEAVFAFNPAGKKDMFTTFFHQEFNRFA